MTLWSRITAKLAASGIALRALLIAVVTVPPRRLFRGPRRPTWSWRYELMARVLKRTFATIWRYDDPTQRRYTAALARPAPVLKEVRFKPEAVGGVPCEWCEPKRASVHQGVYVYFHGGGYTGGSTSTHRELIARQTLAVGGRTLAVNYRLAPEHPFPAAIEDAVAVYRALRERGTLPGQIIFGGDSAGGNLVVAAMLALRERQLPLPRAGVCLCPWVDLSARGGSLEHNSAYDWASPEDFITWSRAYLGGLPERDPRASPAFADLHGLSPLLVQIGTAEMLLDQVRRFVDHAQGAGVEVTYHEYEDMVHNWHILGQMFAPSLAAIAEIGEYCRRAWSI